MGKRLRLKYRTTRDSCGPCGSFKETATWTQSRHIPESQVDLPGEETPVQTDPHPGSGYTLRSRSVNFVALDQTDNA